MWVNRSITGGCKDLLCELPELRVPGAPYSVHDNGVPFAVGAKEAVVHSVLIHSRLS
jgi:hypothetical protein